MHAGSTGHGPVRCRRTPPSIFDRLIHLREVEKIADELVIIGDGKIDADDAADELLGDGADLEDLFLSLLTEGASR